MAVARYDVSLPESLVRAVAALVASRPAAARMRRREPADRRCRASSIRRVATRYEVAARSTDVFGRVLCSARHNHFVIDGPIQNGCPGEALTPADAYLAGIAACAVELIQVFAREEEHPLRAVEAAVQGDLDRDNPVRDDVTVFNRVCVRIRLEGVDDVQAERLVERFKGR